MKHCKDCAHFSGTVWCRAPENGESPLDGKPRAMFATERRSPPIINLVAALVLAALLPKAEHPIAVLLGWVGIGCAIVISYMLGYIDAARLEIDHLRGATKMVEPAQPVAWLVYLPSIDTQNVYDSQDDPGYVDDVTNHADAEVTPLYEMAATKAEVAPAGEYPAGSGVGLNELLGHSLRRTI